MRANKRTENRFYVSRREFLNRSASLAFGFVLVSPFSPFLLAPSRLCRELVEKSTLPRTSTVVHRATFTMGTIVQVSACGENRAHCNHAIERMFAEFYRIDRLMSVYKADSQISQINRQAGRSGVRVDQCLVEILELANRFSSFTDGAFDVTIEPLMELWGFRSDNPPQAGLRTRPSDREIAETLQAVGHRNVIIDQNSSTVGLAHPRSRIDLGGIAVGYSLDRAAEILRAEGIEGALINHSGDLFALGGPQEGDAWEVHIADPLQPETAITSVRIRDSALSTSGSYRNFLEIEGERFGHIMDPRNGFPRDAVLSTTAIAPKGVDADGLSTAAFVLGPQRSETVLNQFSNVELISIVLRDGRLDLRSMRSPSSRGRCRNVSVKCDQ